MRIASCFIALMIGLAAPAFGAEPIAIAEIGHILVGGETTVIRGAAKRPRVRPPGSPLLEIDPNGDYTHGATYVHFVRLAQPRHALPILLLPGGGLSGASYETTPDGRPGWQSFFLRAGYSVFTADLQETGRSPFARYPEIDPDEPSFRDRAFLWEIFRIGPPNSYASLTAFEGTQFPVAAFDDFAKLASPRFRLTPEAEAKIYDAIVAHVCPCVVIAHSASGGPALAAAQRHPELVKTIVVVEPASVPETRSAAAPTLHVWGDYLRPDQTQADWQIEHEASRAFAAATGATFVDLPAQDIRGNSHLPMMDRNSDEVARVISRWIDQKSR